MMRLAALFVPKDAALLRTAPSSAMLGRARRKYAEVANPLWKPPSKVAAGFLSHGPGPSGFGLFVSVEIQMCLKGASNEPRVLGC